MSKRKSKQEKEALVLRRQVEALRAELKQYKPAIPETNTAPPPSIKEISGIKSTVSSTSTPNYTKKDLIKTGVASLACLLVLGALCLLLPHQERIVGFLRYGDFKTLSHWKLWN